jgi:hypothetical protein
MPVPSQDQSGSDLPAFEGADQKVVRLGTGAALVVLAFLLMFAALATGLVPLHHLYFERLPASSALPLRGEVGGPADEGSVSLERTEVDARTDAAEVLESVPPSEAQADRIDAAFRTLDTSDIAGMRRFLEIYGENAHAESRGYVGKVRDALRSAEASAREAARALEAEEKEEEQRRREQQQAVPWDMGVVPPSSVE